MRTRLTLALLALLAVASGGCTTLAQDPAPVATGPAYTDYADDFVAFYDRTEGLPLDDRVAAFKAQIAPLFPAFYAPRDGRTQEDVDRAIASAIEGFPKIRDRYMEAMAEFPEAYATARVHFSETFPDSDAQLPTWFIHSLGEMDGGTRTLNGTEALVFGADGIAKYHTPGDLRAFFDHELFHVEHGAYFTECEPIWCSLWSEGLATAAAEQLNPGTGDAALMLEVPRPIRPAVDAHWLEAVCLVQTQTGSTDRATYKSMFYGNGGTDLFPPRWGYYVGYRLAQRVLHDHTLVELAHMPHEEAQPLVARTLAAMVDEAGGCDPLGSEMP